MSKHQLKGRWYDPSSLTRFFTHEGELINVVTGKAIAKVHQKIEHGNPFDVEDGQTPEVEAIWAG